MEKIVTYSGLALEKTTIYKDLIPTAMGKLAGRATIGSTIALGAALETLASSLLLLIYLPISFFNPERVYYQGQYVCASALTVVDAAKEIFNQKTPPSDGKIKNPQTIAPLEERPTWREAVYSHRKLLLAGTVIAIVALAVVALYPQKDNLLSLPKEEVSADLKMIEQEEPSIPEEDIKVFPVASPLTVRDIRAVFSTMLIVIAFAQKFALIRS